MAQQTVSIGSSANDGTGDPLRTAFTKINANFTELFGTSLTDRVLLDLSPQLGGDLDINGHNIVSARTNENIRIIPAGTGTVELESNVNVTGNLVATGDITANGNINLGDAAGDQVKVTGVFEADQLQIDGTTLTTTLTNGDVTITGNASGGVVVEAFSFNDSTITSPSNSDISIQPGGIGNLVLGSITLEMNAVGTQIVSNDSTQVVFGEDVSVNGALSSASLALATGATVTGILDEDAMGTDSATQLATQQSIKAYADTKAVLTGSTNNQVATVTGAHALAGEGNLTFDGSTLAVTGAGTFSTTLGVTGTLTTADITTTGTHAITGTLNADWVQIKDNKITTNASDADLEISANGSGSIDIQNAMTTVAQTVTGTMSVTGQFNADNLRIDGNVISATTGGITITPAANQTVALGGIATTNELHATLGEFTTLRTDTLEIDTSDGDMSINTQGTGTLDFNTPTQSTVGSAGGGSALPGAPTGYLKIKIAGTLRVIPFWDQA
jgi:hypothetical protein